MFTFSYNRSVNIIQSVVHHAKRRKRESTSFTRFSYLLSKNFLIKDKDERSRTAVAVFYLRSRVTVNLIEWVRE